MASTGDVTSSRDAVVEHPNGRGVARLRTMWRLFRREREEPAPFYRALAAESARDLEQRYGLAGATLLDAGCGPGWFVEALRRGGATVVGLDGDPETLTFNDPPLPGLLQGDAGRLPFADESFDGVFCSNLLEHARDTRAIFDEMARVLRPGGWGYMSWTNWYSPHGGHDMSPWHLLGPERGSRLYEKRFGPPPKNRYGEGLFAVHIGPTLRLVRAHPELEIESIEPRYWPKLRFICSIPGARELLTWNCVIRLRKAVP
jgi:SAM-dependent methyltransferase